MIDITPDIIRLHRAYGHLTGLHLELTMPRHYAWECWMSHGWRQAELELVIHSVKRKIKAQQKWTSAINFNRIVIDTDSFDMELAEARAQARTPKLAPGLQQVMAGTGRSAEPATAPARSADQILKDEKAFHEFQKFRESL